MNYFSANIAANPRLSEHFMDSLHAMCSAFVNELHNKQDVVAGFFELKLAAGFGFTFLGQNTKEAPHDPADSFFLVVQEQGASVTPQGDNAQRLLPGSLYSMDSTQLPDFMFNDRCAAQASLLVPRDEMQRRYGERINEAISLNPSDSLGVAIWSILVAMLKNGNRDQSQMQAMESFFSVFGSFLLNRSLEQQAAVDTNQLMHDKALSVMAQHYSDPGFSARHAAEIVGVSIRKLQRVFERCHQISPQQQLQKIRMESAKKMLHQTTGQISPPTITSIAFSCGFNDLSTFYRQFRQHYQETPKDYLRRLRETR